MKTTGLYIINFAFLLVLSSPGVYRSVGMNGSQMAATATALTDGSQIVNIGQAPAHSGVYLLVTERAGKKISSKIWID